ncbi:protein kinase [Myxococcaceae bacterium GXIMD 01537]
MGAAVLTADTLVLDGRFRVLRPLGSGGMGEVYLGEQVSLGRKVAIKVLHHDLHLQPGMAERFKREARILSAVEHPAVVRVIDFGESGDAACLVMELVEGESLHDVLNQSPFAPARALTVLHQLAEGLAAIHDKGIIHRDLKPENVVLTKGPRGEQARLLDFGIARFAEAEGGSNLSQVGVVLGTPEYLSPEQALGTRADTRSDLYSFGVLAYRVFSGRLPFAGPLPRQFLAQHAHATPRPLLEVAPALAPHPHLAALVMRLLEKDPANRFPSAHALADALAAATLSLASAAPAPLGAPAPAAPVPASSGTAAFGTAEPPPAPAVPGTGTAAFGTPGTAAPPPAPNTTAFSVRASGGAPAVTAAALSLKSRNVTVMLTSVQEFAERTSRQTREENARMLEAHDSLLPPLVKRHGGKLVHKRGDSLLALFPSPTESVLCGMALQHMLWRHNQTAPPETRFDVRVCLHAGEVLLNRDSVLGEPMEVVKALQAVATAGDVTFTEAVNLARNRAEADAEPCGTIPLPGNGEPLQVYRCKRTSEGAPFGARFEVSPGLNLLGWVRPVGLFAVRHSRVLAARLAAWARMHPRHALAAGAATVLVLGGGTAAVVHALNPVTQARALLADGNPGEALARLKEVPEKEAKADAALQRVRARALHALNRHDEEYATLSALKAAGRADAESEVLDALAEDFGQDEGDRPLRTLLRQFPKDALGEHFRDLAGEDYSPRQWGALRYLEAEQLTEGVDLRKAYSKGLEAKNCPVRVKAARRLETLNNRDAIPALQKLAALPLEKDLNNGRNCGQNEAAATIQALDKKLQ